MESNFFLSRVNDTADICSKTCVPKFLGFLTSEEASTADILLKKINCKYTFFGGYNCAERVYLACLPEWCDEVDFPITALTFNYRSEDKLTHRDFLGSLMSLGIAREKIGDILIEDGRAVVFAASEISNNIITQISKAGRVRVTISVGFSEPLPSLGKLADFIVTVASARIDCVISALCGVSRSKAAELIEGGFVSIKSIMCDKTTRIVRNSDKITVRGKGKFIIDNLNDLSKKGRIILKYKKYI